MKTLIRFVPLRAAACVLLLGGLAGMARAQTEAKAEVWEGTLGKAPIVAKFDPAVESDDVNAHYFYRKHRHGIVLSGKRAADGGLALEEWAMDGSNDALPVWQLAPAKGDRLSGEWVQGDQRLPIRLRRVSTATLPATDDPALAELRANDPYVFLQLQGLPLKVGKLETVGDYRLQWWREPTSGVELFRVLSGYSDARLTAVNRALARKHWGQVQGYLDCTASSLSDFETSTTLRYIGRDALSVSLFTSYYCGGAHPDFGDSPLNFDPRTGQELALEDVLWLGKGEPPVYGEGSNDAWFAYRSSVFAPWVAAQFGKLYPDEFSGETNDDCSYEMEDIWDFPTWYITKEGVYLGAIFPRAARVCDDHGWSILPWAVVNKHHGAVRIKP